ncbi:MAG: hypothetical protein PHP98_11345 [Kiritimatiellae bacterium]|nr:hypothetical protein [Kiritimatiellia bacterium]
MEQYKSIADKVIPARLEDKTSCLREILDFARKYRASIAVLIASARRDNFKDDVTGWIDWARGNELAGSDLHHLRQIGNLLLDVSDELYRRLFPVDTEKLLAMSRLPRKDITRFLEAYPPEKLSRDEVRAAVCECLGEAPKSGSGKSSKYQPDMFEAIDAFLKTDDEKLDQLFMDERFDGEAVGKCYKSGMVLVENVVNYLNVRGGDPTVIATAEQQLRAQADKLAEIRERVAAQLQAG